MKKLFVTLAILTLGFSSCKKCYICSQSGLPSATYCPGDLGYDVAKGSSDCKEKVESNI